MKISDHGEHYAALFRPTTRTSTRLNAPIWHVRAKGRGAEARFFQAEMQEAAAERLALTSDLRRATPTDT